MLTDLKHFEGNAQSHPPGGEKLLRLNLTLANAQTAGLLGCARPTSRSRDKAAANHYLNKKPGFDHSEEAFVDRTAPSPRHAPGALATAPVAYIMEAADDISYCLADIEDSVEKGRIPDIRQLADLLAKEVCRPPFAPDVAPIPGDAGQHRVSPADGRLLAGKRPSGGADQQGQRIFHPPAG
ncbi:hypothetical protein P4110_11150 [Pseudomonas aeruginosa]|nr:hypothetical protein [Pseudomonas aeruginosa]